MRSLPKPDVTGAEVLQLCAASIRDPDLKERLLRTDAVVKVAEELYREHGEGGELHAIKETKTVGDFVTAPFHSPTLEGLGAQPPDHERG